VSPVESGATVTSSFVKPGVYNLGMAAAKSSADPCLGIGGSTMVATMARNGTEFGIRVAGLGDRWFTAPVNTPSGLYFPGFGPADANPDIGDSAITETAGLGGFAMAASPAVAAFVGAGGMDDAIAVTEEMAEICLAEHPHFRIPTLDDRGAPVGIDIRKVVETGIGPLINTGMAGVVPGTGQIGPAWCERRSRASRRRSTPLPPPTRRADRRGEPRTAKTRRRRGARRLRLRCIVGTPQGAE
jgi:Protein of unknown function (DUF1116)